MSTSDGRPIVLIVDDQESVADTYALRLRDEYETRTAYGGEEALEAMDEDVDAVLLDRRMPDLQGDEVLAAIREEGYDCVVIMTTAVDPDLNILEMDFDDYLCKPIFQDTLIETLEGHLASRSARSGKGGESELAEFFRLVSKLTVLQEELTKAELENSEEVTQLRERIKELGRELRETHDDFEELYETHRSIERGTS